MSASSRHRGARCHRVRAALRLASSVSVLVVVAAWVVGCGDPQPPVAVGIMPKLTVEVGSSESIDLAAYFSDPDGDGLSYAAASSNAEVATVAISGDAVAVTGVASGSTEITVTASDGSSEVSQDFTASVHADRQVLEILYDELGGDNWRDNTYWLTDAPLEEWYGASANADGRVDALDLWANSLRGEIPPELGDLS
ncbi:MAG: Ig-like domain-containing protein, partial [Gemmatimonadetes bacterium]|nr:Ig-like domain-containing protein [Gemmatimonadota bacterium]